MNYTLFNKLSGLFNFQFKDGSEIIVHLDKKVDLELIDDKGNFKQIVSLNDYRIDRQKGFTFVLIDFSDVTGFKMAELPDPFTREF